MFLFQRRAYIAPILSAGMYVREVCFEERLA